MHTPKTWKAIVAAFAGLALGFSLCFVIAADYQKGTSAASSTIGTPVLAVRQDRAQDDAGTNQYVGRLSLDSFGSLRHTAEGGAPTYAATSAFASDSTGTDIAMLPGVTTKVLKLIGIKISTTATAAATGNITIFRRSALDTGQTAANSTAGQYDGNDAAPAALPVHFTGHPTALGTSAGTLYIEKIVQQAAGTPPATVTFIDFRTLYGGKCVRINNVVTDNICINAAAALAGTGNAWAVTWIWQEAPITD